ncbi:hypothetical protein Pfo_004310 [Paulownia fortunei]|nr:hypothetical protein Pfo_004310 [Paulownia fortunei]
MSKICISNCVNDTRIPVRATYVNLYKWPESDAEFVRSAAEPGGARLQSRVVDSISCRQMYLRSYTFSRKETMPERTKKCFVKVRERVVTGRKEKGEVRRRRRRRRKGQRRRVVVRRVKEFSCAALCAIFRRLLFCTATVDVVDHDHETTQHHRKKIQENRKSAQSPTTEREKIKDPRKYILGIFFEKKFDDCIQFLELSNIYQFNHQSLEHEFFSGKFANSWIYMANCKS